MDLSKQDSLTRNSQRLASESKSPEIVQSNTTGPEAKFDQVSPLGGNSRVLPVCAKVFLGNASAHSSASSLGPYAIYMEVLYKLLFPVGFEL